MSFFCQYDVLRYLNLRYWK